MMSIKSILERRFHFFNAVERNLKEHRILLITPCSALEYKKVKGKAIHVTGRGDP
jgi:hypothetical protein